MIIFLNVRPLEFMQALVLKCTSHWMMRQKSEGRPVRTTSRPWRPYRFLSVHIRVCTHHRCTVQKIFFQERHKLDFKPESKAKAKFFFIFLPFFFGKTYENSFF